MWIAAAAIEAAAIQNGPMILDRRRILADEVVGELRHRGGDGVRAPLDAPARPSR